MGAIKKNETTAQPRLKILISALPFLLLVLNLIIGLSNSGYDSYTFDLLSGIQTT
jgi:hypothetical protein